MFQLRLQSRSEASGPPVAPIPALEQKISIRPTALVTVSTMNFTWDSLETSQQKNAPRPSSSSCRTLKPLSSSTSAQATRRAPSLANLRQSARPIPLAPPVTTTTFPLICMLETILASLQIFKPSREQSSAWDSHSCRQAINLMQVSSVLVPEPEII